MRKAVFILGKKKAKYVPIDGSVLDGARDMAQLMRTFGKDARENINSNDSDFSE